MPDMYIDVNTAIDVPVNVLPLMDDTTFKDIETGIVFNAAGMDLNWNFVTSAGVVTQTNVVPTVIGDYDWGHQGNGMYTIEIPASGGASINNDREGYGWFSGVCDGVLPWCGPRICFRAAGINDKLCDWLYSPARGLAGTALPNANADAAYGLPTSDAGGLNTDGISSAVWSVATRELTSAKNITNTDAQVRLDGADHAMVNTTGITTASSVTVSDKTGFSLSPAGDSSVADQVWNELIVGHTGGSTFGGKNQRLVPSETIGDYKATGFSTHSAASVWSVGSRVLTAANGITNTDAQIRLDGADHIMTNTGSGYSTHSAADVSADIWAKTVDVVNFSSVMKMLTASMAGESTIDNTNKVISFRDQANTAVVFNTTFGDASGLDSIPRGITNTVIQ